MISRSSLLTFAACGLGIAGGALLFCRPDEAVSSAAAQQPAGEKPADELAQLKAEVQTLKDKATDQAHVMVSVSYHFANLWFAAQHNNWPLAQFYWNETRSHLRWGVRVIPIRKDNAGREVDLRAILESVEMSPLKKLEDAIKAEDHEQFVAAYKFMLEGCYACHKASDKPYIRTQIPSHPADPMVNFEPPSPAKKETPEFRLPGKTEEKKLQTSLKAAEENSEDSTAAMLVEPAELKELLESPDVRILDTRPKEEYAKGHVPGAVLVDVKAWQALGKTEGGFRNAKAWGELVGRLGIARESTVVLYGSRLPDTARVWWLLKYVGVNDVRLLNGGWDAWSKAKLATTIDTPTVEAVVFEPEFQADRLEEIDSLKESLKGGDAKIVDTRSADEFTGKQVQGERGGHIPGATHLEWSELLAADGRFKTKGELQELFKERGILPDDTAVCY
jgi:thiosulfate/3-mercaptopyruvate sulfurtransferase